MTACGVSSRSVFHRDQSSHFMLRAICSDSDEHFQWFLENEIKLLDFKVGQESVTSLLSFCNRCSLELHKVDGEELDQHRFALLACQNSTENLEPHFKVPFASVLDLVAKRIVFLHLGFAFVPASSIWSLLKHRLGEILNEGRSLAKIAFLKMKNDDRFKHLINHVTHSINKSTECLSSSKVSAPLALDMSLLPNIAEMSFPWCMLRYYKKVAAKMRIDHTGWLQYTSFLKDSGATVTELTEYWGEFYKSVGRTHSDMKKVNYDIRHLFDLEGQRKEFKSFSCKTIISGTDKIHG